ncbi:chemotaxis protein CheW [Baaleninema sp.]|uniref:chemotaxis protein CheW n=1 Tax=Baaleninema sp. TaxID=3101197 RepID=UPI003D0307DE
MERDYFKIRVSSTVRVALPLSQIEAALQIDRQLVCPVPGVAPALLGVVNRRGTLTWVLDLSHFLELGPLPAMPGQTLKAIALAPSSEANPKTWEEAKLSSGDRSRGPAVACVVTDLEGVFSPQRELPVTERLKPRLQGLIRSIVYDGKTGLAVLDPDALLRSLRETPLDLAPA